MGMFIKAIEYVYAENKITNKDLERIFPDYDFLLF